MLESAAPEHDADVEADTAPDFPARFEPPAPDRSPAALTALLWLLALLAATGFEVPLLANGPTPMHAVILLAVFVLTVFGLALTLTRYRRGLGAPMEAPRILRNFVSTQARRLGASRNLRFYVVGASDAPMDASCMGLGKSATVYVTPSLAEAFNDANDVVAHKAQYLINRALSDIAISARATVAFARAGWITVLIFLPVKFVILGVTGRQADLTGGVPFLPIGQASEGGLYFGTHIAIAAMMFILYRMIVRRCMFALDRRSVGDEGGIANAGALADGLLNDWCYGMHGKSVLRPNPNLRREMLRQPPTPVSAGPLALMLTGVILLVQLTLAGPAQAKSGDAAGIAAALTILALSFVFAALMTPGEQDGFRIRRFMLVSGILGICLASAVWAIYPVTEAGLEPNHVDELRKLARLEAVLQMASIPLLLGALVLGQYGAQRFFQAELATMEGRYVSAGVGAFSAAVVLWILMMAVWHPHQAFREDRLMAAEQALERAAVSNPNIQESDAEALAARLDEAKATVGQWKARFQFHPPFSIMALWQVPMRVDP